MFNQIFQALLEIVYPRHCAVCQKKITLENAHDGLVCAQCIKAIIPNNPPFCQKCGKEISGFDISWNICAQCYQNQFHFDRAWAGYSYDGVLKELIHTFKYKNKIALGKCLSRMMIEFVRDYHLPLDGCDYVIPIPLSPAKLREREFNQARILADNIACHYRLIQVDDNLGRIRNTTTQTELNKNARRKNVQGAFRLKEPDMVKDKTILLVDDVLTTGATASEAAKVLKDAGASAVYVLTLAN